MSNILKKSRLGIEDLAMGFGVENQIRGQTTVPVTRIQADFIFNSLSDIKALNTARVKFCSLFTPDGSSISYYYDPTSTETPNDTTVIAPNSGTGRWLVRTLNIKSNDVETVQLISNLINTVDVLSERVETVSVKTQTVETVSVDAQQIGVVEITTEELQTLILNVSGKAVATVFRGKVVDVPIVAGIATIDWEAGTTFNINVTQNFGINFINFPNPADKEAQCIWITFRNSGSYAITGGLNPELGFTVHRPDAANLSLTPNGTDKFIVSIEGTTEVFVMPIKNFVPIS